MRGGKLLTVAQCLERLPEGISAEYIYRQLRCGRLRGTQPSGRRGDWFISESDLDAFLASGLNIPSPTQERAQRAW